MNRLLSRFLFHYLLLCGVCSSAAPKTPQPPRRHDGSGTRSVQVLPSSSSATSALRKKQQNEPPPRRRLLMMRIPTCTSVQSVPRVALLTGSTGLLLQLGLTMIFQQCSSQSLRETAAYTAHTVIALALMVIVSWIGVVGWWCSTPTAPTQTAEDRLLAVDPSARWLAALVTGMLAVWDVPTSCWVPQLRQPDMIVHHIVMTGIAYIGAVSLPMHYLFFYLGISELSSIPLLFYNLVSILTTSGVDNEGTTKPHHLVKLREQLEILTALSFTLVRTLYFTFVTLFRFVPDVRAVLPTITSSKTGKVLRCIMVSSIGFTALQLYWFWSKILLVVLRSEKNGTV